MGSCLTATAYVAPLAQASAVVPYDGAVDYTGVGLASGECGAHPSTWQRIGDTDLPTQSDVSWAHCHRAVCTACVLPQCTAPVNAFGLYLGVPATVTPPNAALPALPLRMTLLATKFVGGVPDGTISWTTAPVTGPEWSVDAANLAGELTVTLLVHRPQSLLYIAGTINSPQTGIGFQVASPPNLAAIQAVKLVPNGSHAPAAGPPLPPQNVRVAKVQPLSRSNPAIAGAAGVVCVRWDLPALPVPDLSLWTVAAVRTAPPGGCGSDEVTVPVSATSADLAVRNCAVPLTVSVYGRGARGSATVATARSSTVTTGAGCC